MAFSQRTAQGDGANAATIQGHLSVAWMRMSSCVLLALGPSLREERPPAQVTCRSVARLPSPGLGGDVFPTQQN